MQINLISGLQCPHCLSPEEHPTEPDKVLIRGFKVCDNDDNWWSHCLVCSGNYDKELNWIENKPLNRDEGWFI